MDNGCRKCEKKFSTKSSLLRHLKKKNPCDVQNIYVCKKCNREFKTNYDLVRHTNRKNPCKKINNDVEEKIQLEIEKELKIIEAKKNAEIEIIKIKKNVDLEIIEAKTNAKIRLEKERKVSSHIETQNNTQNNIYVFPTITEKNHDYIEICNIFSNLMPFSLKEEVKMLREQYKNPYDLLVAMLRVVFNNKNFPNYKSICYDEEEKILYSLKNNEWKEDDNYIYENVHHIINKFISSQEDFKEPLLSKIDNMINYRTEEKPVKELEFNGCIAKSMTEETNFITENLEVVFFHREPIRY
jgi:Zinc finger, C2H2 type